MSITIEGLPILVDRQRQLRHFLADRLPPEEILFARWQSTAVCPNPFVCDNAPDYIDSPYPPLPPLSVGEIQWPSGASRYARALYAVDWSTLRQVATTAWGWEPEIGLIDPEGDPDDPENQQELPTTEIPDEWGASFYEISLAITDGEQTFTANMLALRPYRVTGSGIDCWLLPLVDSRWKMGHYAFEPLDEPPEDMGALIDEIADSANTTINKESPAITGGLDKRLWGAEQPSMHLLDAACLSSGLRVVRDPAGGLRAVDPDFSDTRRGTRLSYPWKVLSGGKRGKTELPKELRVHCRKEGDVKFHVEAASVSGGMSAGGPSLAVWTSWLRTSSNSSATVAFAGQISASVSAWGDCGGQYCLAGSLEYLPSGYDDYMSILLEEKPNSPDDYIFRTTIRELPGVFLPRSILIGGGDDDCCDSEDHFLFTLDAGMTESGALAEIRSMDDSEVVEDSAMVKNTLGHFSHLGEGDRGICVKVDDVYYAVHPDSGGGESGGVVFTLTADLAGSVAATATATVIVSGVDGVSASDSITVYNTGKKKSWTGALGWAIKIGSQYWVSEIDQYPVRSIVVLYDVTHNFSSIGVYQGKVADQKTVPVNVSSMVATTPYPFSFIPDPLPDVTNPFNLIGLAGDKGLVTYNEDADEFQLVEIYPQEKRRVAFKLTEDMETVEIENTDKYRPTETREFTSGEMPHLPSPPTDPIYDVMGLIIDGKDGDEGIIEYSYRAERWEVTSFRRRDFGVIEFIVSSATTVDDPDSPYDGMRKLTVTVVGPSSNRTAMFGEAYIDVYEHDPQCLTVDETDEALEGRKGWAYEGIFQDQSSEAETGDVTPRHWVLQGLCCP